MTLIPSISTHSTVKTRSSVLRLVRCLCVSLCYGLVSRVSSPGQLCIQRVYTRRYAATEYSTPRYGVQLYRPSDL